MGFKGKAMLVRIGQRSLMEWLGRGPGRTLLKVIDATAETAELCSLMLCVLEGSSCWTLGLSPRHCVCNEKRHGP